MQTKIHPVWYPDVHVTCACGNSFVVGSTKQSIKLEICDKCHPFFTGEMKFVDTMGRVERFQQKQKHAQTVQAVSSGKKKKKQGEASQDKQPKSLREMLLGA